MKSSLGDISFLKAWICLANESTNSMPTKKHSDSAYDMQSINKNLKERLAVHAVITPSRHKVEEQSGLVAQNADCHFVTQAIVPLPLRNAAFIHARNSHVILVMLLKHVPIVKAPFAENVGACPIHVVIVDAYRASKRNVRSFPNAKTAVNLYAPNVMRMTIVMYLVVRHASSGFADRMIVEMSTNAMAATTAFAPPVLQVGAAVAVTRRVAKNVLYAVKSVNSIIVKIVMILRIAIAATCCFVAIVILA